MVDSSDPPASSTPAELVSARIAEKRLFEAGFLLKKISSEIDPSTRRQLRQQLENRKEKARQIFVHAEKLEEQGQFEKARQGYSGVIEIAVDFPGIDQALQRVTVALALGPLASVSSADGQKEVREQAGSSSADPSVELALKPTFFRRWKRSLFFAALAVAAFVLFAVSGIFREKNELPAQLENSVAKVSTPAAGPLKKSVALPMIPTAALEKDGNLEQSSKKIVLGRAIEPPIVQDAGTPVREKDAAEKNGQPDNVLAERRTDVLQKMEQKEQSIKAETAADDPADAVVRVVIPAQGQAPQVVPVSPSSVAVVVGAGNKSASEEGTEKKKIEVSAVDHALSGPSGKERRMYTVRTGDTLEGIADKVYGDHRYKWSYLVRANRGKLGRSPYTLSVGARLVIPSVDEFVNTNVQRSSFNSDGTYIVQSGDSLGSIAVKVYGSSRKWQQLYELNRDQLSSPSSLQVGQRLRIRGEEGGSVDSDPVGE